jgi:tRNA1Val (adenine37-N6)-methyltransferase
LPKKDINFFWHFLNNGKPKPGRVSEVSVMGASVFHFKKFCIHQDRCGMKLTTDAILFGAWNEARGEKHVLDIGSGTGLLALMWSYKLPEAKVTAIEPESAAAEQAAENFLRSDRADHLQIFPIALQEFKTDQSFDLIVCNPPFFEPHTFSPEPARRQARTRISLRPEELFHNSLRLLAAGGRMLLLWPASDLDNAIQLAERSGLHLHRLMQVKSRPSHPAHIYFIEFSDRPGTLLKEQVCIYSGSGNTYSPEFMDLTRAYYLRFPAE